MSMKALDLFCGAGGVARGLKLAGFDVTGVDIKPQPRYAGDRFIQADAMTFPLDGYDFIWASPPCQAYSALRHLSKKEYPDLVAPTRARLVSSGTPYVIENLPSAPLLKPVVLCGSMFNLRVRRHRAFESTVPLRRRLCLHWKQSKPIDVSGTGGRRTGPRLDGGGSNTHKPLNLAEARHAMGIDWMTRYELSQAIPPAYSKYIGDQVVSALSDAGDGSSGEGG